MNTLVKIVVILVLSLVSRQATAQTNFEKGMSKAFELWEAGKWDDAENMFERISKAEEDGEAARMQSEDGGRLLQSKQL